MCRMTVAQVVNLCGPPCIHLVKWGNYKRVGELSTSSLCDCRECWTHSRVLVTPVTDELSLVAPCHLPDPKPHAWERYLQRVQQLQTSYPDHCPLRPRQETGSTPFCPSRFGDWPVAPLKDSQNTSTTSYLPFCAGSWSSWQCLQWHSITSDRKHRSLLLLFLPHCSQSRHSYDNPIIFQVHSLWFFPVPWTIFIWHRGKEANVLPWCLAYIAVLQLPQERQE